MARQDSGNWVPVAAKDVLIGNRYTRYALPAGAGTIDPLHPPIHHLEKKCLRTTEISKMKGQGLVCGQNAKLIAVNNRYIAYAMKEGALRVINQNGKELFKLHNTTKAVLMDMAINGTGLPNSEQGTTLLCIDQAARASVFVLEALPGGTIEERTKKIEFLFPKDDPPQRILGHPTSHKLFVTAHANHLGVWSLALIEEFDPRSADPETGFISYEVENRLAGLCSVQFSLPSDLSFSVDNCDLAVSLDAQCLLALADGMLCVWRLESPGALDGEPLGEPELIQQQDFRSQAHAGYNGKSLRILGGPNSMKKGTPEAMRSRAPQVLVVATGDGCRLFAFDLKPQSDTPVGALLQTISIQSEGGAALDACIDDNRMANDALGIGCRHRGLVLVLPLALGWGGPGTQPFPYAQRFITDEPAHQLSIMSGKSYQSMGHTIFMYRAHNFTREKDSLLGCNIGVSEVEDSKLVAREQAPERDTASGDAVAESAEPPPRERQSRQPPPAREGRAPNGPAAAGGEEEPGAEPGARQQRSPPPPPPPSRPSHGQVPNGSAAEPAAAAGRQGGEAAAASSQEIQDRLPAPPVPLEAQPPAEDAAGRAGAEPSVPTGGRLAGAGASSAEGSPSAPSSAAAAARPADDTDAGAMGGAGGGRNHSGDRASDVDWAFVKQIAASFVKGLDKKRGEMAHRLIREISEAAKAGNVGGGGAEAHAEVLEKALSAIRDAKDAQTASDRSLQAATRKAAETWAESSAQAVGGVVQKELGKISDGVAATLAQQLTQSKKFCEALAKGVQRSGGAAVKQAVEGLRPPKQLQETVGNALSEALQESLAPVFKSELRQHFEQELAPLIGQRIGEMMASFRDRMTKCLDTIASEHEAAGQRLGRELAPVVAEELRQVERVLAQHRQPAAGGGDVTEAQLDDITRTVQAEIVQPLQARIQDLSAQVQTLREETRRLEERWRAAQQEQLASRSQPSGGEEERQAAELEALFHEGKAKDAFIRAMQLQADTKRCDFLGRLCSLVPEGGVEEWLGGSDDGVPVPLTNQVKMLLMLSLTRQLEGVELSDESRAQKIDWISELWFCFDVDEPSVRQTAGQVLAQLNEALESIQLGGCSPGTAAQLRKLKKSVNQTFKLLRDQQ